MKDTYRDEYIIQSKMGTQRWNFHLFRLYSRFLRFWHFCRVAGAHALLVSALNVTSAGQLAGVPLLIGGSTMLEMALTQLLINMRYFLTSISLSQKLADDVRSRDKFAIAYVNTDEVFAICASRTGVLSRSYLYGLIIPPVIGWVLGTAFGALAGNVLSSFLLNTLGFLIYGMFLSILVPPARRSRSILPAELIAVLTSSLLYYIPYFSFISPGFSIIIAASIAALIMCIFSPLPDDAAQEVKNDE